MGGPGMPPPPRRPRRTYGSAGIGGTIVGIFAAIILLAVVIAVMSSGVSNSYSASSGTTSGTTSTIERTKLDSGNAYMNDCIVDELGWFDSVSNTESKLKEFWQETGVQPYIILKAYDPSLTTNAQKDQWAVDYYDSHFDTENIFLYVYFAEEDEEGQVGYMAYANGYQTSSVMDSEAVEIFWNNIDKYWYSNASTDEVFINAFCDTGETIMKVSTTGKDILKWIIIAVVVIAAGLIIIRLVKMKNQRAKEKAEEDQKILNTPIHDMAKSDLEEKYLDK
jgi:hypothetical protein